MILKNAEFFDENFNRAKGDIKIDGEHIGDIGNFCDGEIFDCTGLTIVPGFIDIHIHGRSLADTCDSREDNVSVISESLVKQGVTSFCPTTMTLPYEQLQEHFSKVSEYKGKEEGAYIHGINMEGPYISFEKKGAQNGDYVRKPDIEEFKKLNDICNISLVDIAPEVEGSLEFAKEISKMCTVSAAHTSANYSQAAEGFKNGMSHATHLFNAMTALTSREPGVVGAVFDNDNVTAELICDGFHISPVTLRIAFKILGEDRTVVVSDSMKAAGAEDGEYDLGGQTVYVREGKALLEDGTIAASTTNIFDEFKNLLSFGIDEKQALKSCTINPAKAIGKDKETGSIAVGKYADLCVLDKDRNIKAVFVKGKRKV